MHRRRGEGKILRGIFGVVKDRNEPNIVQTTKINRLRWLGYVQRMEQTHVPTKLLNEHPEGKRRAGRLKRRWRDAVKFKNIEVIKGRSLVDNMSDWKNLFK